ncbi:MAG: alpha/beta fold hydrolase [Balneolaceae bacterium]|nr:alpha/beta fold hydrolase [Balneolaceae bacterium]
MKWVLVLIILTMNMKGYSQNPKEADTIELNGLHTYFEVYGKGSPLFLLHGFTQSSQSWVPFINEYSNEHEIYLVDLMGHGKSSPFTEDVSIRAAAQNLKDLIEYLELDSINAIGYSYGGEILFQLALLEPDLIKSMIIIGSCGTWEAKDFPEFVEYLSYKNIENLPWMRDQQVSEDRMKNILDQIPNYSVTVSESELKSIKTRPLLVVGDNDHAVSLDCVIKAKTNMPNAFLWIVPNTEHRVHIDKNRNLFIKTSKDFLNKSW